MAHKPVPPELIYEYLNDGDMRAVDDVFNFLFDRFFSQKGDNK